MSASAVWENAWLLYPLFSRMLPTPARSGGNIVQTLLDVNLKPTSAVLEVLSISKVPRILYLGNFIKISFFKSHASTRNRRKASPQLKYGSLWGSSEVEGENSNRVVLYYLLLNLTRWAK